MLHLSQGPAVKESQKWIQKLVNEKPEILCAFSTERVTHVFFETGDFSNIL